jgi:hypothetical protein
MAKISNYVTPLFQDLLQDEILDDETFGLHEETFGADDEIEDEGSYEPDEVDAELEDLDLESDRALEGYGAEAVMPMTPALAEDLRHHTLETNPRSGVSYAGREVGEDTFNPFKAVLRDWMVPDFLPMNPEDEAVDIFNHLVNIPEFRNWQTMPDKQKRGLVNKAMLWSMSPVEGDDSVQGARRAAGRLDEWIKSLATTKGFWMKVGTLAAALAGGSFEVAKGCFRDFYQNLLGVIPMSEEQYFNTLAIYYLLRNAMANLMKVVGEGMARVVGTEAEADRGFIERWVNDAVGTTGWDRSVLDWFEQVQAKSADFMRTWGTKAAELVDCYDEFVTRIDQAWTDGRIWAPEASRPTIAPEIEEGAGPMAGGGFEPSGYTEDMAEPASSGFSLPTVPVILGLGSAIMTAIAFGKSK